MTVNRNISIAFVKYGYSIPETDDEVEFSPLSIWVSGEIESSQKQENGYRCILRIKTRHEKLFPDGIYEYAYGWGETEKESFINAAYRWIDTDFNAIHDLLCDRDNDEQVESMELVSLSKEEGVLGWKVIFGSLLYIELQDKKLHLNINHIFLELFDLVNAQLLNSKGIYPIKVFVMKNENGEISLDCRLNGNRWIEGEQVIRSFAEDWIHINEFHYRKQYMIIHNKELKELKNAHELLDELEKEVKKYNKPS